MKTYDRIIVYSCYTKSWAEKYYGKEATVLHPPVDTASFVASVKESIILSVGRFCMSLHSKKQLETVKAFKKLYDQRKLADWEYHLVGGLSNNIKDHQYLEACKKEAEGYPISFHVNAPFRILRDLYGRAKIFWHATGLGEDENQHPERMEHFGITTVEAMSAGCVPVVINKGGQPEIVRNGIDGFLWNDVEELKKYTLNSVNDSILWQKMSNSSVERSQKFGIARFTKEVDKLIGEVKNELGK
jgi:glycosyltransferase involved in cell wall biosynthesis